MKRSELHIDFLDYFRGAAIIAVFLFHSLGAGFDVDQVPWGRLFRDFSAVTSRSFLLLSPLTYGWAGVAVFFAVSGFCIHLSYIRNPQQGWTTFFGRRFWRLYPPYLVALLIFGIIVPWLTIEIVPHIVPPFSSFQFFTHLFLIHNYWPTTIYGINPALWSIAVEVQLYALFPLLLMATSRWSWQRTLLLLGCLEVALRLWQGTAFMLGKPGLPFNIAASPIYYWFSWSIGAWLADAYVNNRELPFVKTNTVMWLLLALLAGAVKPLFELSFLLFAIFATTWIAHLLEAKSGQRSQLSPGARSLQYRSLQYIGIISYSLYLLHQPLLTSIKVFLGHWVWMAVIRFYPLYIVTVCLVLFPAIVLLATLFYRHIEMPSVAVRKWISVRRLVKAET